MQMEVGAAAQAVLNGCLWRAQFPFSWLALCPLLLQKALLQRSPTAPTELGEENHRAPACPRADEMPLPVKVVPLSA